jgi:hypothetical protein
LKKSNTTSNFTEKEGQIKYESIVDYWDEKKKKYRIFSSKDRISIFRDNEIVELFDHDPKELGYIMILINSMDNDNMIGIYNKHLRYYSPINSRAALYELLGITNKNKAAAFYKKLKFFELIKEWCDEYNHTRYFVNPRYTMADRGISLMLYKLFMEDLDKVLPYKAKMNLKKLCSDKCADNSQVVKWDNADNIFVDGRLYDMDTAAQSEEEKNRIFNEYILHDEPAKTYQKLGKGYVAHELTNDNDTYFLVNRTDTYKASKPSKSDISGYNAWYVDIDCGTTGSTDPKHKYYPMEEVIRRKQQIKAVIDALPTPTAIVDTRNGYHIYWACYGLDTKKDAPIWQQLQNKLHEIVKIADPTGKDSSRILRLPGSNWIKAYTGLPSYRVTILEANPKAYDTESFQQQLEFCKDKVQAAAESYMEAYPEAAPTKAGNVAGTVPIENQTERIQAIADLSLDTFAIPEQQKDVEDINTYLRVQNLAEFLQIENPARFKCILHNDHHPSASIYKNDDNYRYYCAAGNCAGHGDSHGIDIIDIVMALSGCRYKQAINYLCRTYGIKQRKQEAA